MKRIIVVAVLFAALPLTAHAQFGNFLNKLTKNPADNSQNGFQNVISKAQSLAAMFAQMPLNNGKLELIKAALPMLTQALTASKDPASTGKVAGLLDQVKGLFSKQWGTTPIAPMQMSQANDLVAQVSSALSGIMMNQAGARMQR